ncbi:MAG: hypothetical protein FJY83_11890, partial [Candidatus Aminicenantes bacterium]|nr:hypothetical protein [Candidatus Aminicenantes bacterium]
MNLGAFKIRPDARKRTESFLDELGKKLVLLFVVCVVLGALLLVAGALAPAHGLRGRFDSGGSGDGGPASVSLDPVISFDKLALAARAGEEEHIRAAWEGFAFAPKSSVYRFSVRAEGDARVSVGGLLVLDVEGGSSERKAEKDIFLARGNHALDIGYKNRDEGAFIDFSWKEVRTPKQLMPRLHLYPRPVRMAVFVLDAVLGYARPLLKAAWLAAAALLLLAGARTAFRSWRAESVIALALFCALAALYAA